jgi:UDP-GlcNAc:undecaprenyl-phosphate GlcNAc-1-phosphate transferase
MTGALYVGSFVLAVLVAAIATPAVAALSHRFGLLDRPGGRRQHRIPIPRPGGLAVFAAFSAVIGLFWSIDAIVGAPFTIPAEVRSPEFRLVMLAAFIGVVIGFIDDLFDIRARWQLLGQLVIGGMVVAAGVQVDAINNPFDPVNALHLGVLAIPFTLFWISGMINALNFIDGLDGLAAGVAALSATFLGIIALTVQINEPLVAWMEFTLAGALLGFLYHNFHPARLFLGTTGVTFVGTLLATLAIFGTAKVAAALLVLGVPIIDTFYVIARRIITGRPPFAPDRGHFHHRLLDFGLSHRAAVMLIYVLTAALGAVAVLTSGSAHVLVFVALFLFLGIVVIVLGQRSEKAQEFAPELYREDDG